MLVDTQIWTTALQDVRTRERAIRTRIQELGIERKLRSEEITRAVATQAQLQQAKEKIAADYAAAVEIALKEVGNAKEALSAAFGPVTVHTLVTQLDKVREDISRQSASLEPLRKTVIQFANERAGQVKSIDTEIVRTKEQLARLRANMAMSRTNTNSSSVKLKIVSDQILGLTHTAEALLANATKLYSKPISDTDLPALLEEVALDIQNLRSQLTVTDMTLATANASLARIRELQPEASVPTLAPVKRWIPAKQRPCSTEHNSLSGCPTCGQSLPPEKRQQREAEIARDILTLTTTKRDLTTRVDLKKVLLDTLTRGQDARVALKPQLSRQRELHAELTGFESSLASAVAELSVVEKAFATATQAKETLEASLKQQEAQQLTNLSAEEASLKTLQSTEIRLRQDIEKVSPYISSSYIVITTYT